MHISRSFSFAVSLCSWLALHGCSSAEAGAPFATLEPLGGSGVSGTVEFTRVLPERIRIRVQLSGLEPGLHGLHIHEFGDCSAPDGASAGGHFNPEHMRQGGPGAPSFHLGDLGNVEAGDDGRALLALTTSAITLDRGPHGVLGRSVVVHAGADDLITDPAGNSGPRVACGVIRAPAGTTAPVLPGP